jgi:hypothetical protein
MRGIACFFVILQAAQATSGATGLGRPRALPIPGLPGHEDQQMELCLHEFVSIQSVSACVQLHLCLACGVVAACNVEIMNVVSLHALQLARTWWLREPWVCLLILGLITRPFFPALPCAKHK